MHFGFHRRNSRGSTNEFGEYAAYLAVYLQSEFRNNGTATFTLTVPGLIKLLSFDTLSCFVHEHGGER